MPVAHKPNITFDTSRVSEDILTTNDDSFELIEIDEKIIDELSNLLDKTEKFEKEDRDNRRKIEKLQLQLKAAAEATSKAQEKKNTLIRINEVFKDKLDKKEQSRNEALDYWINKHGINVEQISTDNDQFKEYQFTYSKLEKSKIKQQQIENDDKKIDTNTFNNDNNSPEYFPYKVNLRHEDKKLSIVSQEPEFIPAEEIETFNDELTKACISHDEDSSIVDYTLAVLKIKKLVLKSR